MNNSMTGIIFLDRDGSTTVRQNLLNLNEEYIKQSSEYFERLASSMDIRTEGSNSTVEFDDLDLSALDAIIENQMDESVGELKVKPVSYISTSREVVFVGLDRGISLLKNVLFIDADTSNKDNYECNKQNINLEMQGCNLTDAA